MKCWIIATHAALTVGFVGAAQVRSGIQTREKSHPYKEMDV